MFQVLRRQKLPDAHRADASDLVLVAGSDAPAGAADRLLGILLVQALFFKVIGKDDVGVLADHEVAVHSNAALAQVLNFFEKPRRVEDDAVADHRMDIGPEY